MVQQFLRDTWWRFERYEIEGGYVRPVVGARLESYDPWQQHARLTKQRRDYEPPFVTLGRLSRRAVDFACSPAYLDPVPRELAEEITSWCSEWGLPGVLLSGLRAMAPVVRWRYHEFAEDAHALPGGTPLRGSHLVPVLTSFEWSSGGWRRSEAELAHWQAELDRWPEAKEGDIFPIAQLGPAARRIVRSSLPTPGHALRREDSALFSGRSWQLDALDDEGWADFFPDLLGDPGTFDYPLPLSDEFWRLYAEPLIAFGEGGNAVLQSLEEIKHPETVEPDPLRDSDASVESMRRLLEPISPDVELDDAAPGRIRARWASPSLLATLALMAYVELTGGDRIDACPVCGKLFLAHRQDHEYCSQRCKATARKRRQRARNPSGTIKRGRR